MERRVLLSVALVWRRFDPSPLRPAKLPTSTIGNKSRAATGAGEDQGMRLMATLRRQCANGPAFFLIIFCLLCSQNALAEQFMCVPDKATGFSYNKATKT